MAIWGSLIPAAIGVLGSIFGGSKASEAARDRQKILAQQQQENQDWFDRRYNENATQRADAQRILQRTEEAIRKRNRAVAGREAVMGGPSEETAREKERGNEMMADAVGQVVDANERRKDQIEQQYMNRKAGLQNQEAALAQEKANAEAGGIQGLFGAASNLAAELLDTDGSTKKTSEKSTK